MKRSHVLALILGATALVWIASVKSGDATESVFAAKSPVHPAIQPAPLGGGSDRSLDIEAPSYRDGVRVSVDTDPASEAGEGSRIWGHVVDARGRPSVGVGVSLWPMSDKARTEPRTWQKSKDLSRYAATNAAGLYEMKGVASGKYSIYIESGAGHGMGTRRSITVEADLEYDFSLVGFLELGGSVVRVHSGPVQLQLARGEMSYGGMLRFSEVDVPSITVGDDGQFMFGGLPPGTYRIRASGSGHAPARFDFELGAPIHDARLVLQAGLRFAGQIELGFEPDREGVSMSIRYADTLEGSQNWLLDGHFDHATLLPGIYDVRIMANVKDEPWRWISRHCVVALEEDLTDFKFRLEESSAVGLSVSLPYGAPTTEGLLTARSGTAHEEVKVRLEVKSGIVKHETWETDGHVSHWATRESLRLELQPGEWEISLLLLGYQPWTRQITVGSANQHNALVEPVTGRILESGYSSRYYRVDVRPTGSGLDWQQLLWRDGRVPAQHAPIPEVTSAFLTPGTYDFRIASIDGVGRVFEHVEIESSHKRFPVNFKLSTGASIRGTLEHRNGRKTSCTFYLHHHDGGSWSILESKTYLRAGTKFEFRGLGPGRYRGTLDRGGICVVAEWRVDGKDIDNQRVIAWPLALR